MGGENAQESRDLQKGPSSSVQTRLRSSSICESNITSEGRLGGRLLPITNEGFPEDIISVPGAPGGDVNNAFSSAQLSSPSSSHDLVAAPSFACTFVPFHHTPARPISGTTPLLPHQPGFKSNLHAIRGWICKNSSFRLPEGPSFLQIYQCVWHPAFPSSDAFLPCCTKPFQKVKI